MNCLSDRAAEQVRHRSIGVDGDVLTAVRLVLERQEGRLEEVGRGHVGILQSGTNVSRLGLGGLPALVPRSMSRSQSRLTLWALSSGGRGMRHAGGGDDAGHSAWTAGLFAVGYGLSIDINTISRCAVPFALFGPVDYGARLRRIAAPSFVAEVAAPIVYAAAAGFARAGVLALSMLYRHESTR